VIAPVSNTQARLATRSAICAFCSTRRIVVPTLLISCRIRKISRTRTGDRIADGAAAGEFFAAVASKDKTLREYAGFEHEIFNERGRSAPIGDAVSWITQRSAPGTH